MANTLYVGSDQEFTSIQAAVKEAQKSTEKVTIVIAEGEYTENVSFGTRTFVEDGKTYVGGITFKAVDGADVKINGYFQCNGVAGDLKDIVFDGLTITNSVRNGGYFAPIMFGDNYSGKKASGLVVSNCTLNSTAAGGTSSGVALAMGLVCDGVTISNNTINADCAVYGGDGNLIANTAVTGNTMNGNEAVPSYNYWGVVYIYNSGEGNEISGNTISNSALNAVKVNKGEGVVLTDNVITDCGEVKFTDGSVVTGNTVDGEALAYDAYTGTALTVCGGIAGAEGEQVVISGKLYTVGTNAFDSFVTALDEITADTTAIEVAGDVTEDIPAENKEIILAQALEIKGEGTVTLNNGGYKVLVFAGADVKVSGVELVAPKTQVFFGISATADEAAVTTNVEVAADALVSAYVIKIAEGSTVDVLEGGKFFTTGEVMRIEGTLNASGSAGFDAASETLTADDRQTVAHYSWIYGSENLKDNYNTIYSQLRLIGADAELNLDNARLEVGKTVAGEWLGNPVANGVGWIKLDGAMTLDNGSVLLASGATGKDGYGLTLSKGAEFTVANGSEAELSAGISNMGTVNVDGGTLTAGTNFAGAGTQAPNYDVTNSGDITISNGGVFEGNNVSNVAMITLSGLTKGEARTIQVSFIPAGGTAGAVMSVAVAANATSVTIPANSLADGSYTVTYVDGGQAFLLSGLVEAYNGKINVNGGTFTADSVAVGKGTFDIDGASSVNVAALDGVANVKGGTLTDSVIGGVVAVTGDTTFEGTNEFSKIWVSGGTLTVDGDLVTKSPYPAFFVIGNDEKVNATEKGFYNGFIGTEAGEMIVNGSYTAEEGVVGNGGKLTVNGEMTANCLYLRGGETTVAEGGSLTGIVWGGVDAGATLTVDGGTFGTKKADGMGSFSNAGTFTVKGSSTLDIVDFASGTLTVEDATTLTDSTVAGAGVVQFAENSITTFEGENKITAALDNSVAGFDFVVNEGASLLITRYTLGYGRDITVKGTIEDATALETLDGVTLSLKADSTSGFSIGGWGTSILDVENAYVDLGKSTWKNATGTYTWSFTNSYVTVGCFGNTTAGSSAEASWESTFKDSVLVSDTYLKTGKGMEVNFTEGSVATIKGSMRIDGVLNIDDTSSVSVNGYFNAGAAGAASEHSDILGTLNIAGDMNIKGSGVVELLGGSVNVQDGGTLNLVNDNDTRLDVLVDADSAVTVNGGTFTAGTITNNGEFAISGESTVDVALIKGNDVTVSGTLKDSNITFETFDWETGNAIVDGELIVDGGTFKNVQFRADEGEEVTLEGDIVAAGATQIKAVNGDVYVHGSFTSTQSEASSIEIEGDDSALFIEDAYVKITGGFYLNGGYTIINGELAADADKKALVRTDADVDTAYATWGGTYAAEVTLNDAYVWNAMISINNADTVVTLANSRLTGWMSFDVSGGTLTATNGSFIEHQAGEGWTRGTIGADAAIVLTEGSTFDAAKTNLTFDGSITLDATSSFSANTLTGEGTITINAAGFTEGTNKVIDLNEDASREGKVTINGLEEGTQVYYLEDGDVVLSNADLSKLYVSSEYAGKKFGDDLGDGKFFGINSFADFDSAVELLPDNNSTIYLFSDAEMNVVPGFKLNVASGDGSTYTLKVNEGINYVDAEFAKEINIDSDLFAAYYGDGNVIVNGDLKGGIYKHTGTMTFNNSKITDSYDNSNINGGAVVTINGDGSWTLDNAQAENLKFISIGRNNWMGQGILNLNDTVVKAIQFAVDSNSADAKSQINVVNSTLATVLNDGLFGNLDITQYGEVNLTDSNLIVVGTLTNNGTVNVTGEGYIKANVSGNGITLNNATLTADTNVGGSAAMKVYGTSEIKGTVGTVHANWTGSKENGLYIGYTTDDVALTLDGATTGNVYVGSDTEGYAAELTVKGGSKVGGIYDRVYGSTVITGSDNVVDYINAKGSVVVKNAENTEITAMVAEGAEITVTDSKVKFAIGTSNCIQLDEGTTMTISGSEVEIQQMTIDATSALKLTNSTVTVDDVYDEVNLITNNGTITIDVLSTLTADSIANNGTITIDAAGFTGTRAKVIDLNQEAALSGVKLTNGTGYYLEYAADGDITIVKSPDIVYVSSDYNSSTEGWGYTHFANYDSAVAYIKDNAKKATMIIEKTTTVSGNCFQDSKESLGVDLTNAVIVKDGAVVGNAQSKWDMTYSVTLEGGAILQSARPASAGIGNTHIKNVLTIGDGSEKRAEVRFVNGLSGITYQTMSIALLGALNRKLVTNNALVEVGDLGINGTASFTDTTFTIAGIFAIKGTGLYKTTMTDSTMTVKGHNLMNENTYYSTVGTILSTLTMDNSSITVDDGAEDTAAEKVWLGYTGNVARTLTLTNGSSITVEKGTEVEVANTVTAADSTITVGTLNAGATQYGGTNNFNFNGLEKGKVYWAVLYDADGSVLEVIERSSTSGSTFGPKFSAQPAGDYKAVCYSDAELTQIHQEKTYSFTAVGTLTLTNSELNADKLILAGNNLTMDYDSTVAFGSVEGGYITVSNAAEYVDNADVVDGSYKLLDYTGDAAMTEADYKVLLNDAWHDNYMVFNNDLYLTDQTASFIRVDAALKDVAIGTILEDGSIVGFNAFATTKAAYMAARDLGGEITIDLNKAGTEKIDDGTIGLGKAGKDGVYTITGGSVDTTSYGLSFADTETTVKFKDATFKLAKLYVANAGGSLIVDNSVIGTAAYSGHNTGWVTAGQGSISINNSIFGANFSNYTAEELAAMPRSASDVKAAVEAGTYNYWAFGANNSGPHMGTAGEIAVAGSTLSTSWISLIDRAEMVLDNSVLYYGAAISIGAGQVDNSYGPYNSNEIGWDAQIWWNPVLSSAAGYREGEVATLTVKDSIVRNIGNGNGNSGAHVQVGGSYVNGINNSVTGECAGVLNIVNSEFYTTPYDADGNAVARDYDMIVVKSNGTVNVDDSTVVTAKLVNEGAFNVTGESTIQIGEISGSMVLDNADLTDSAINKGSVNVKGENTFAGDFNASYAFVGDWSNEEYSGSIDFGTDSNVYVGGQMIIGYDSTVAGANQVVFGDVTGAVVTDKVFKAADVSVRRDGTLTIANTTGENKINTMNVMGEVVIDNAKLSGEVQIGNNSDDIDAVMTVQNGAEVTLGGSSNSIVILGKSTSGTMNVDNATVTVKRAGAGAGYNVPADTFVIGYNGGVGELNLTNGANFTLSDYNGDQDGGKMNLLLNGGSTITADNSTIDVAGNFENASSLELSNGASATVGSMTLSSALRITGLVAGDKRTITVAIIKKGETKGTSIQIDVEKNSTSAEAYLTDYAGGDYDITVIDSGTFLGEATIVNGMVKVDGASFTAGTLNICNGAFDVTGESKLKINSVPGETAAVKFIDGTLTDSDVQGTVNAYGETVFRGTNNIKVLATGRDSNYTDVTTTQIFGNFTTTNMLTGTVNADSKVYIGAADEERTTAYFGQLGGFGKVAVENADVTYRYAFIRNNFDVKNSTLENTSVNTYFAGNAKVVVDNSTWTTGAYTAVGSYGGYMYGNADVTIQNGSTLSAGNFDIEKGGDYIVKVTVDNAALMASSRITLAAGTSLTLLNGAVAETSLVTNNGTVTVDGGTFSVAKEFTNAGTLTVTSSVFNADSISNAGTITITAVENEKLLTFGALSNTGSIAIDGTGISGAMVKLLDYTGDADMTLEAYGNVILSNAEDYTMQVIDNDLYAVTGSFVIGDIAVNSAWSGEQGEEVAEGRYMGINAFNSIDTIPASGLDKVTIIDSEFEVSNDTFTDPSIEIVLENSKLTGSLTLTGARLVVDEESSTSVTMTVENGIHICGGGSIDNAVSGDGIATLENITVTGIDGFSQINATDVTNNGSFSMTTGYDEITINGTVEAVEGIDFKTGEDKLFISEDAKLTTAWIKNEDDLTISIDLGAAYDGSAAITVVQDGIFGSAELVINLDVVGAELGTTNMLVEGISAFNGTIVIDGEELALGGIYAGADYEYKLVLNDNGLALEQIVPEIREVRSDVDGNGYSDIVLYHTEAGFSGAWLTQKDGSVEWGDLSTSDAELLGIGKMDDTKALFYLDEGSVGYWKLDENGKVTGYETVTSVNDATNVIGLGDFNGDGSTDLLLRNDNGMVGAFMSGGTGWTEFQSLGAEWNVAGVGDLNNDGIDDVILHHTIKGFSGAWLINEQTENSAFASWGNLGNLEGDMKVVGTGDFNGDGYEDVLISDGKWVGAWMVENGNMTGEVKGFSNSLNGVIEQIGDFNSDGIDDLRLRDQDILGYLSISVDGTATWQQLGKDGVGDEWKTKFSAIC